MTRAEIVKAIPSRGGQLARPDLRPIAEAYFSRRSPQTVEAYRRALLDFAGWMGQPDPVAAIQELIQAGQGQANMKALAYMAELKSRGLSPSTMNQRLAAIKSMIKLARQAGMITWGLEVEAAPAEAYRNTQGPGRGVIAAILSELRPRGTRKAIRDHAIFRLLWGLALRRAELCALDLGDVDLAGQQITVQRKGQAYHRTLHLGPVQQEALRRWITARGQEAGPLFPNVDRAHKGNGRLTPRGLYRMVEAYGRAHGAAIRPHGIRHTAITEYLRVNGGDVVKGKAFSGHKSNAIFRYVDNTADLQAEAAACMDGLIA